MDIKYSPPVFILHTTNKKKQDTQDHKIHLANSIGKTRQYEATAVLWV